MKLTKRQLKRIIKETLLREIEDWDEEEEAADEADYNAGVADAQHSLEIRKDASPAYLDGWAEGGGIS